MGCCCSRFRRDQEAEKYDVLTHATDNLNMPKGNRKRRSDEKEQAPKPTKVRPGKHYKAEAADWNKLVADLEYYKQQVSELNKSKENDDRVLKDNLKKVKSQEVEQNRLLEKLKASIDAENKKEKEIVKMQKELTKLKQENNALQTRVSSLIGANLTNNNPNIADLSDANRPTKLADQYNELYDNEWTDAITSLDSRGISETRGLEILRDMLMKIYNLCENKAEKQMTVLSYSMEGFMKNKNIPTQMIKHLKETRKENYRDFLPELNQAMQKQFGKTDITKVTQKYQEKCLELCWLICIQDPPVFMDCDVAVNGKLFDKQLYKEYTSTGRFMDYLVWPALHLFKGGAILCKGTAQAMVGRG